MAGGELRAEAAVTHNGEQGHCPALRQSEDGLHGMCGLVDCPAKMAGPQQADTRWLLPWKDSSPQVAQDPGGSTAEQC